MSEEGFESQRRAEVRESLSWWYKYDGKPVFVQLREPYVGVTYPNAPVMRQTDSGPDVICIPFLRGVLRVRPDASGSGLLLIVETSDPNPANENCTAEIVLHPEDVLYCTHIDKKMIQGPH
jgi:hypothetical protein